MEILTKFTTKYMCSSLIAPIYVINKLFFICFIFCRYRPTGQVGRQLAMIGDDINERYAPQFNSMIKSLHLSPDTAYEAFAGIARK